MKKILLFSALLCAISYNVFAQSTVSNSPNSKLSIGFDAGLPLGSTSTFYSSVLGGDLKYLMPAGQNVFANFSVGYTELMAKDFTETFTGNNGSTTISGRSTGLGVVPLKVGIRYYSNVSNGFFLEAQAGAAFIGQGGGTAFAYSPGLGFAADGGFDMGVRYEAWMKNGTIGQVTLRIAYDF